jgi:hypothetical protein
MKKQPYGSMLLTLTLLAAPGAARAAERDIEGRIEALGENHLVVGGKTIHVDARTDFDDGLASLADLKVGDRVEIDYVAARGERLIAREIELDA